MAAEIARSEGIAEGGYRIVTNIGDVGRPDGRPPPLPPHGRPSLQLAPGMTGSTRRVARRSLAAARARAGRSLAAPRGSTRTTFPPLGSTPAPAGDATAATEQQVIGALAAQGLQAADAIRTYRPPEGPLLAAAPRTVLQVDPAGRPEARLHRRSTRLPRRRRERRRRGPRAYISSGTGRIQFPPGPSFVLRVVGSTVVFFSWSPDAAPDPECAQVASILGAVGTERSTFPS